jgi:hypothetical protein
MLPRRNIKHLLPYFEQLVVNLHGPKYSGEIDTQTVDRYSINLFKPNETKVNQHIKLIFKEGKVQSAFIIRACRIY